MILSEREYHKMPVALKMPPPWKCLKALLHLGLRAIGGGEVFSKSFFINVDSPNLFVEKGNYLIIWRNGECHKAEYFIGEKR